MLRSQVDQEVTRDSAIQSVPFQPSHNNLPRLKLSDFDGDPLKWLDWSSMFKSIVDDSNISLNAKIQHLQNSVLGKAKTAIEEYGYCGDSYKKLLTLGKLRVFSGYSDLVSTVV